MPHGVALTVLCKSRDDPIPLFQESPLCPSIYCNE